MEVSTAMARFTGRVRWSRPRRRGEHGAQSLEWIALGSFVATMMAGATVYARDHGAEIGTLLVSHLHGFLSQ
jgi:hypothetical protein